MIAASVKMTGADFGFELDRITRAVQRGMIDPKVGALPNQAKLLAQTAMKFTPPKSMKQGRTVVQRDTNRAARSVEAKSFENKRLRTIIQKNNQSAWNAASKHFKKAGVRNTHAHNASKSIYSRARDRRGRVLKNTGDVLLGPQARLGRREVAKTVKRVGWAKGGWNLSIIKLKGKAQGAFAKKHGTAAGIFSQSPRRARLSDSWIKFGNNTQWGQSAEAQRIARYALKIRTNAMRNYFTNAMKRAARTRR